MTDTLQATPSQAVAEPAAVRVSLTGRHGAGCFLKIDRSDWDAVVADLGEHWGIVRLSGRDYVATSRAQALRAARAAGMPQSNMLILSRWLARRIDDTAGSRVYYANNDTTDLRRRNLTIVPPTSYTPREPVTVEPITGDED